MPYALQNALYQWEEGESRLRERPELERADLEAAVAVVLDELRRRLGSSYGVGELAEFYAEGVDWAAELARGRRAGADASYVVDAAFYRYARGAVDFAGGRPREGHERA
ncbi:MAG: hypothetical protein WD649_06305 [Thermoleophilaceae bacterium]